MKYLKGIEQVLVIYPYVVAGGFTVAKKNNVTVATTPSSASS